MKTPMALLIAALMLSATLLRADPPAGGKGDGYCEKHAKPVTAADWVAAWQAAQAACPTATSVRLTFRDRMGPALKDIAVFDCVTMKACGELLVLAVKNTDKTETGAEIVRAMDIVRIEFGQATGSSPDAPAARQ